MGVRHDGIDKVASLWTLHGWRPSWTRTTITIFGLKSPSTWMYDSTTYRNHDKNHHVFIVFDFPDPSFTIICKVFTSAAQLLDLHV